MVKAYKPVSIQDPLTGKKVNLSPKYQDDLLERGIFLGPIRKKKTKEKKYDRKR